MRLLHRPIQGLQVVSRASAPADIVDGWVQRAVRRHAAALQLPSAVERVSVAIEHLKKNEKRLTDTNLENQKL